MKRLLAMLLAICITWGILCPVYATDTVSLEDSDSMEVEIPNDGTGIVTVSSYEEIVSAIDEAQEGDTLAIAAPIIVDDYGRYEIGIPGKTVRIVRSEGFIGPMFIAKNGVLLFDSLLFDGEGREAESLIEMDGGCPFFENCEFLNIHGVMLNLSSGAVVLSYCFIHNNNASIILTESGSSICVNFCEIKDNLSDKMFQFGGTASINDCLFENNVNVGDGGCITISAENEASIQQCTFKSNISETGTIVENSGRLFLTDCTIIRNNISGTSDTIILNSGSLNLTGCVFAKNSNGGNSYDILTYGDGIVNITDSDDTLTNIYDALELCYNGTYPNSKDISDELNTKIELPVSDYFGSLYFASSDKQDTIPELDSEDQEPQPSETDTQPQEPSNGQGQLPSGGANDGQEPPEGEDGTAGDDQEPPTGDNSDPQEPSDGQEGKDIGTGSETSQGPSGSNQSGGYDHTPPSHWWPSAPSTSHVTTEKDKDTEMPTNDVPLDNTPRLVCGSAVIDTSRTIVLLGCGDGQLHEEDPLTRAQAAQIIYRLLTVESAVQLYTLQNAFMDVPAAAWYAEAVSTIASAGVVVGCGNGLFCPEDNLTWAQALTILARFVEPQEYELQYIRYQGWALDSIQTAVALGWIRDTAEIVPDALITRGQMANLVNLVLELSR